MRHATLAVWFALAGCTGVVGSADGFGPAPPGGNPGNPGTPPSGPGGSGPVNPGAPPTTNPPGGMMPGCVARLVPVSAPSFEDLPAAPTAHLQVRVELITGVMAASKWTWSVLFGMGQGTPVAVMTLDELSTKIDVPLMNEGLYQIKATARVNDVDCTATVAAFARATDRRLTQFRIRLTPGRDLPYPVQETAVQALAGKPLQQNVLLLRGEDVTLDPHDDTNTRGVASYVRVTQSRPALTFEGHTARAPFHAVLLPSYAYDVLVVPDGDVPPMSFPAVRPAGINVLNLRLTAGQPISGRVVDGAGAPVNDARVILRAGVLTSTVGTSAGGSFTLRARENFFGATISPPPASGLPELFLAVENGLPVEKPSTLDVKWAPVTAAPVSLVVRGPAGPAAGARVRLDREMPLAAAGTLTFTPTQANALTRPLLGYVRVTAQTDASGAVDLHSVPPGRYQLTIVPPDGDRTAALTILALDVPAGGVVARPVTLAVPVSLRGTLAPAGAVGARVFATPAEADPPRPVAEAVVGPGGAYALAVDPNRSYVVWADPGNSRAFGRALLAKISSGATGADVGARTLPAGLVFSGLVIGALPTLPQSGVVIQVFCDPATSASCLDPTIPLAEGVSGAQGDFTLALPDPGSF